MYFFASAHRPMKLRALVKESSSGTVLLVNFTRIQYVAAHAATNATATGAYLLAGMWVMGNAFFGASPILTPLAKSVFIAVPYRHMAYP